MFPRMESKRGFAVMFCIILGWWLRVRGEITARKGCSVVQHYENIATQLLVLRVLKDWCFHGACFWVDRFLNFVGMPTT